MKCLGRPIKSILEEYTLIYRIWSRKYPNTTEQLPLSPLECSFMTLLVLIRSISLKHLIAFAPKYKVASFLSEFYVFLRLIFLLLIFLFYNVIPICICYILVIYFLIDGLNYRLCIIFVDRYDKEWGLRSLNRSLILLMINYVELIIGFAVLFLISGSVGFDKNQIITLRSEALYFSVVTVTTLGYGDIKPLTPFTRWLSITETLMGFILIVLVIGTFLTGIKNIRNITKYTEEKFNERKKP